ncbi:MAG TPA: DUF6527 family protein [Burkholderiaceae bacterium]|nr:DUF6527 family protein [Burkholderiaceae bacterium]
MGMLSAVLRNLAGGGLAFRCPGCQEAHVVYVGGDGPGPRSRWEWDGNVERPTFSPSILVTGADFTEAGRAAYEAWYAAGCPNGGVPAEGFERRDTRCHSFVRDGQIEFLGDCTHALAGQTVPLPAWPGSA